MLALDSKSDGSKTQSEQVSTPAYHPIETAGHPAHPCTVAQGTHPDPADLGSPSAVAAKDAVAASRTAAADWAAAVGADWDYEARLDAPYAVMGSSGWDRVVVEEAVHPIAGTFEEGSPETG